MKQIAHIIMIGSLLALGACMQSRWDKPNTSPDTATADLNECRQTAQREAARQTARYGLYSSAPYNLPYEDARWRTEYEQRSLNERFYLQNRFAAYCMHSKGYERVPVQPS